MVEHVQLQNTDIMVVGMVGAEYATVAVNKRTLESLARYITSWLGSERPIYEQRIWRAMNKSDEVEGYQCPWP